MNPTFVPERLAERFAVGHVPQSTDYAKRQTLGQFELLERVGMGKFGSVWKARDMQIGVECPFMEFVEHTFHYIPDVAAGFMTLGSAETDGYGRAWPSIVSSSAKNILARPGPGIVWDWSIRRAAIHRSSLRDCLAGQR